MAARKVLRSHRPWLKLFAPFLFPPYSISCLSTSQIIHNDNKSDDDDNKRRKEIVLTKKHHRLFILFRVLHKKLPTNNNFEWFNEAKGAKTHSIVSILDVITNTWILKERNRDRERGFKNNSIYLIIHWYSVRSAAMKEWNWGIFQFWFCLTSNCSLYHRPKLSESELISCWARQRIKCGWHK